MSLWTQRGFSFLLYCFQCLQNSQWFPASACGKCGKHSSCWHMRGLIKIPTQPLSLFQLSPDCPTYCFTSLPAEWTGNSWIFFFYFATDHWWMETCWGRQIRKKKKQEMISQTLPLLSDCSHFPVSEEEWVMLSAALKAAPVPPMAWIYISFNNTTLWKSALMPWRLHMVFISLLRWYHSAATWWVLWMFFIAILWTYSNHRIMKL